MLCIDKPPNPFKRVTAELMFARKIRLAFDKLLPRIKIKIGEKTKNAIKHLKDYDKVFYRVYGKGKVGWEDD